MSSKLTFSGVGDRDVYNICAPFRYRGQKTIAGRVEARDSECAEIAFFVKNGEAWTAQGPRFPGLQDPCITRIDGRLLLGGVRFPIEWQGETIWRTEFYLEDDQGDFHLAFTGPPKMKDIRLLQLPDGRLLVLTRPQGEKGGRGRIGFTIVADLASLRIADIDDAPLLDGLCEEEEWVGANEPHWLSNGDIGILGHIANFDTAGDRHYFPMAFRLNLSTGETTLPQVLARRVDFPAGDAKRPDLVDVLFSGGLIRLPGGRAQLYVGMSDAEAGCIEIADPFADV